MRRFHRKSVIASRLKAFASFSDNFSLSSGMKNGWKSLVGSWSSNAGSGSSDTSASSYPMSYVKMSKPDITASVNVSSGTGLSFWITDTGSWYATTYTRSNYSYDCNPYSCCYSYGCSVPCTYSCQTTETYYESCNPSQCNPYPCNPYSYQYNCNPYSCYVCDVYGSGGRCLAGHNDTCYSTCTGTAYDTCYQTCYQTCGPYTRTVNGTCSGYCSSTCTSCSTCYQSCNGTYHYLKLLKSASGTVSELTSAVSLGQAAAAIYLKTSGNDITVKAYSDTSLTNQIGSTISYTATSPVRTSLAGVVKSPSDDQASTVGNLTISIN